MLPVSSYIPLIDDGAGKVFPLKTGDASHQPVLASTKNPMIRRWYVLQRLSPRRKGYAPLKTTLVISAICTFFVARPAAHMRQRSGSMKVYARCEPNHRQRNRADGSPPCLRQPVPAPESHAVSRGFAGKALKLLIKKCQNVVCFPKRSK